MEKINIKDARIASALKNSMPELYDGVFIMFHRKSDNYPLMVEPYLWPSYQSSGEIADGVVIVEGGKILVVAPTESLLFWSNAYINGGGTTTTDRLIVLSDWDGEKSTKTQSLKVECSGESYTPGFCNSYSRININGQGLTAGKWWQPSVGEMIMISANFTKVNYALSLINGAMQLTNSGYWTSTEYNMSIAWVYVLGAGKLTNNIKSTTKLNIRPVSAFII